MPFAVSKEIMTLEWQDIAGNRAFLLLHVVESLLVIFGQNVMKHFFS